MGGGHGKEIEDADIHGRSHTGRWRVRCRAEAHKADLEKQTVYDVDYKRYWVNKEGTKIFCLVDAPNAETAAKVHREAHVLVADEIYEVTEGS